ncbi:hypothetical protein ACFWP2_15790 [Kitasatospora sp. NPDC058444]|uniref:hypothetical protein n=1 Tax=Kitasatospora sp. NPDC058444 TaxID=3346504 RepID=UPI0036690045
MTRMCECACNQGHPVKDSDVPERSCGSWWLVTIAVKPDVVPPVRAGTDASLLPALRAVQEVTASEESAVRGSAEKWIAGVTAVFGLFGLVGVAVGKDSLTGLDDWARALAGAAIAVALGSAGWAVYCTSRVAYGWPVTVDIGNDALLIHWFDERRTHLDRAAKRLRRGVAWSAVCLGLLFAAVGLIWFGPRTPAGPASPLVLVTRSDGSQVCGTLLDTVGDGELRVRRPDGSLVTIPASQLRTVRISRQCGR